MIYIDFDGVILDTEELIFEDWRKIENHKNLSEEEKIEYISKRDWKYILNNSPIINDSVYYLKYMDPSNSTILTRIHSLNNEGVNKALWIRENNIKQNVIFVPYGLKKTDIVDAKDNILIDDGLFNLTEWENNLGIPVFFDMDDDNVDSWGISNSKGYQRVKDLSKVRRI